MKTVKRNLKSRIVKSLAIHPVVFVNGPRQAGKSTLVQELPSNKFPAEYISFDNASQMAAASLNPVDFLVARQKPLIIDEVQLVPDLFRALKVVVDDLRKTEKNKANGSFLLTGSANILALPQLSDALVGRMNVLTLYPFSCSESISGKGEGVQRILHQDFTHLKHKTLSLIEAIGLATYPEIAGQDISICSGWFEGYLGTILQREVKMIADLEKVAFLPGLLRLLSTRAGCLINDADIARDIGLNAVTGKFYRKILQMMFLTFDVQPWYKNIGKRLVKSSKGYITDTLLLCHMLGYNLETLRNKMPELFGHIVENFVATELMKLLSFDSIKRNLFHFRTSDGKEVDFIIENPDGSIVGVEVKTAGVVSSQDVKGLIELQKLVDDKFKVGVVFYSGNEVIPFGKNIWAVPFYLLWQ